MPRLLTLLGRDASTFVAVRAAEIIADSVVSPRTMISMHGPVVSTTRGARETGPDD
ncbi:uncharacterized protein V6R79_008105 [Siganus canaliculatus]